ncbi:transcriptional regulator family: Fungal Specific TF [Paecilomyces variotii]|nr:transcriptional regulator family: Fungal Specific TF [Paecilomyces variotii]KAJ9198302.1 transcriptional regulator family: Fungal Specific TF [Paecilomyces variotii]KAJ9279296.1 transcriptional regulator family: Fungal Specific TF [Paecilomyces variotii]KAJ9344727.1 transcriptional regulator family: Fungal Specific TF [Paecilomyces variotii]KAJ9350639.1 transcriptional regulator family: Fungal Specific TF [Paecilomyces variotii]
MGQIPAYSNPLALSQRYSMENGTKHYITKSRGRLRVVKNRTQHSCTNCRKRKVKCDRVQPCSACCRRGDGFECTYVASVESRKYMRQAEIIATLKHKIEALEKGDPEDQTSCETPTADEQNPALRTLDKIAFGSADEVAKIVSQLRGKTDLSISPTDNPNDVGKDAGCKRRRSDDESSDDDQGPCDHIKSLGSETGSLGSQMNSSDDTALSESAGTLEVFQDVFLDTFLSHFAPDDNWRCDSDLSHHEMRWLYSVARSMSSLPHSRRALHSIATASFGKLHGDARITATGHSMYAATLETFRRSISTRTVSTDSLCTTLILWLFEMINYSTPCGWLYHLYGAEELFQLKGPDNFALGVEHELFLCFREHGIIASMIKMQPTFLSDHKWKTLPWSGDVPSKNIFHRLLDHVADIAGIFALYSRIEVQAFWEYISLSEIDESQQQLVSQATDVVDRLREWKAEWTDNYAQGQPYEVPTLPQDQRQSWDTQGFQLPPCPHPKEHNYGRSETSIYYPDFILAHSMILYYGSMVLLSRIGHESSLISDEETEDICRRICRSVEYHIFFAPGGRGATALMFALRQAYLWFPVDRPEREWLEDLFVWMREMVPLAVNQHGRPPFSERDMARSLALGRPSL